MLWMFVISLFCCEEIDPGCFFFVLAKSIKNTLEIYSRGMLSARQLFINMLTTTMVHHIRPATRLKLSHVLTRSYGSEYHTPVLCNEVCDRLLWNSDGVYVDCTLGGGGHTAALLDRLRGGKGRVISIDQDRQAIQVGDTMSASGACHGFMSPHTVFAFFGIDI